MAGSSHTGKMTPSKEDYLKVMLELSDSQGMRSTDIASALGVTKASVSRMTGVLKDEGYVIKEKYGAVTLTEAGRSAAANIRTRYELLKSFFHNILGVEADIASRDACRAEHFISSETAGHICRKLEELSEYQKHPMRDKE